MATLRIPDENRTVTSDAEIREILASVGIEYERWSPDPPPPAGASDDDVLRCYESKIAEFKAKGGYVAADVIGVSSETPGLDAMMAKFGREHRHSEDEVRFIVEGHGLFHLHPENHPVLAVEIEAGDLISVPAGILHWFVLCGDRRVRAVRLFQNPEGWVPDYSESGIDSRYEPVCFGPAFVPLGGR